MGLRGPKPKGKVKIKWSPNFAYAIGLLATDGNVAQHTTTITLTSKDLEQIHNFIFCLKLETAIGKTHSGFAKSFSHRIQFKDRLFHDFLLQIGIRPAKSKTLKEIVIPTKYFFDFLRGSFDGDGCFYSYWDKRFKSSHMMYLVFASASKKHLLWLRKMIQAQCGARGHVVSPRGEGSIYELRYAKKESVVLIQKMYYNRNVICLSRKRRKIERALKIDQQNN